MTLVGRIAGSASGRIGLFLVGFLVMVALAAPWLMPHDPFAIVGPALLPPFSDPALPLGTDSLGRDLVSGLIAGTRVSLAIAAAAAVTALVVGALVGTAAGFAGGLVDEALMRLVEAVQTVPRFLLALAFVSVLGGRVEWLALAIALGAWAEPARLVRAEVLSLRERDYVAAARVIGMHPLAIALREVMPGALSPLLSLSGVIVAAAILTEAALSFLGLGDPNVVSWGSMIAEGRNVLRSAPHLSVIPGLALLVAVLGVYLLAEAADQALRPGGEGAP